MDNDTNSNTDSFVPSQPEEQTDYPEGIPLDPKMKAKSLGNPIMDFNNNFTKIFQESTGTTKKVLGIFISLSKNTWRAVPFILFASYLACVWIILSYFYDTWSLLEKLFWFYFSLHYVYYLIYWSFFKCHFSKSYSGKVDYPIVKEFTDSEPYCEECQSEKQPRTHHCSLCNKCVAKYDHHCNWMSACIGYHNIRYYFLFFVGCSIGMLICDTHMYLLWTRYSDSEDFPFFRMVLASLFFFNVTLVVFIQFLLNALLISFNMTIIEAITYLQLRFSQKKSIPLPYYKTLNENWREAFLLPDNIPTIFGFLPYDFQENKKEK
ncbi:Palmitoyltransferase [Entamoeba marina]